MKLTRVLSLPFTLIADAVTLFNIGGTSFTQQVLDADRIERSRAYELALVREAVKALQAAADAKGAP